MILIFCSDIRNKVRVQYMNFQGLPEPGVDGGGVFREFLNDALKTGFDPNRGYFSTTSDGQLYPNAQARLTWRSGWGGVGGREGVMNRNLHTYMYR